MNYFGIVGLFNGIVALLIGLYVFFRDRRNELYLSFSLFTIDVALWSIFYAIWQSQESKEPALFFARLLMSSCYYIPFAFLWFVLTLLEVENRKKYLPLCLGIPSFFLLFSFSELNVKDVLPRLYFPYWPTPGFLMHLYVIVFFIVVPYCFYLLFRGWFRSTGMRRWQLRWVTLTMLLVSSGGSTNWFLWYNVPIPPFPNVFVGVFLLLLAYTVIRRQLFDIDTLAGIVQEAKLSAIGTLAASINHEIRNPLYVVKGMAESFLANKRDGLLDRLSPQEREEKVEEILTRTVEQVSRAVEITKRLAEFSRPRVGQAEPENLHLNEVVDEVLSFVGHELEMDKIKVERELSEDTTVRADRKQIEEILLNLMINACQAMPKGGFLKIADEQQNGRVIVRISDTGEGISRDNMKRIFDPFFSTKQEKGTGLGLYVVKKLVERNGGRVKVSSVVGRGSTFSLELVAVENG